SRNSAGRSWTCCNTVKSVDRTRRRVDSVGILVFSSHLLKTATTGEIGQGRRRRSNRPGNSQAKAPRGDDSIWKEARRALGRGVRRRDNTLRQSDRWGFGGFFGNRPGNLRGPL